MPSSNPGIAVWGSKSATTAASVSAGDAHTIVLQVFNEYNHLDEGLSTSAVVNHLRGRLNESDVRRVVDELSSEGHLYSTIDDEHFKSSAN